jgi:3',5'-nucleoside bisphosphate phosphatase
MGAIYDLHSHSFYSDGTLSPTGLVSRAHRQGVTVLALTDHDSTEGLAEARTAAEDRSMTLIGGVEISVTWGGQTFHILGLNLKDDSQAMQAGLSRLRDHRRQRAEEIDRRLAKHKITGTFAGAARLAKGAVSRTHFAHHLVHQGYAKNVRQAFKRFLSSGRPGHVAGHWADLEEATGWIRNAGGDAVLAHPARYQLTNTKLRRLLAEFKECGGGAIEVVSGSHSPKENALFAEIACQHELLASVGSDYHGPEKPWVELGRLAALPPSCQPVWNHW